MRRAILLRAISIMVFPAMFGLVLACGAAPLATAPPPADIVAPTASVSKTPGPVSSGRNATETPTGAPTQVSNATAEPAATAVPTATTPVSPPTPAPAATAVPTATTLPSPTPAPTAKPTAATAPTPEPTVVPTVAPTADPSSIQAEIIDFKLPDITIPAGATIIWTNLDIEGHTTTSGKDGVSARFDDFAWDSRGLDQGESFSVTFGQPGTFPYTCKFHPWMNGTVTVEASSSGETSGAGGSTGGGDGY